MMSMHIPLLMTENVHLYFGDRGKQWLKDLPNQLEKIAEQWSLDIEDPFPNLSINFVAPAKDKDGKEVVLKLGVPNREIYTEIAALKCFNGTRAVKLIADEADDGVMLLEKIHPGTSLRELKDDIEATKIAGQTMKNLWVSAPQNHSLYTLREWFSGLTEIRSRFDGGTGPFPSGLFDLAEKLSDELLSSTCQEVVLHGDLHHENIVKSDSKGWIIIDPKGIVGDPAFEVCSFLRNPVDLQERYDIEEILPQRVAILSEILGFDTTRLAAWGLAEAILSSGWSIDDPRESWRKGISIAEVYAQML